MGIYYDDPSVKNKFRAVYGITFPGKLEDEVLKNQGYERKHLPTTEMYECIFPNSSRFSIVIGAMKCHWKNETRFMKDGMKNGMFRDAATDPS